MSEEVVSFLDEVERLAAAAYGVVLDLRLGYGRDVKLARNNLEDYLTQERNFSEPDSALVVYILQDYFTAENLAKKADLSTDNKDPIADNSSVFPFQADAWRKKVYTARKRLIDMKVETTYRAAMHNADIAASRSVVGELYVIEFRTEGIEDRLHNPSTSSPDDFFYKEAHLKEKLYKAAELEHHDQPLLLYKTTFRHLAKSRGWHKLSDADLVRELDHAHVPLEVAKGCLMRRIERPAVGAGLDITISGDQQHSIRVTSNLVDVEGNLQSAYAQIQPGTMCTAAEITKERLTNESLRQRAYYTANGIIYCMQDGKPVLYITPEKGNLVLRHLADAQNSSYDQLVNNHNYRPSLDEVSEVISPGQGAEKFDLSDLVLAGGNDEWQYFTIGTSPRDYSKLIGIGKRLAERVFGSGPDFTAAMQMFADAGITATKIGVLKPSYVASNAGTPLGRASWLDSFSYNSSFIADDRTVDILNALRGVAG